MGGGDKFLGKRMKNSRMSLNRRYRFSVRKWTNRSLDFCSKHEEENNRDLIRYTKNNCCESFLTFLNV